MKQYFRRMTLLSVQHISKMKGQHQAVAGISFNQSVGERIAIAGATGSGKSTLLKLIAGLEQPDAGVVYLNDIKVDGPFDKLIPGHKDIAYLSQHFELRNNYWVHEILSYANLLSDDDANLLYQVCDIQHLLQRRTDQLSGGEKQRIALARLLSTQPKLLLLDEPFSNLDQQHKQTIRKVIHDIGEKLNITCILVSHDGVDTLSWADRIFVMHHGAIVQTGTPLQIYHQPVNDHVAALFGDFTVLPKDHPLLASFTFADQQEIYVRPSSFLLSRTDDATTNAIPVTIEQLLFFGSYYLITVSNNNQQFIVAYNQPDFFIGEIVYLSVTILPFTYSS